MKVLILTFAMLASPSVFAQGFDISFSWLPQDNAFTQKLSGVRFEPNSEGISLMSFSLLFRYNQDSLRFYEFEHTEVTAWMGQFNTSVFNVKDSRTSLDSTIFRGFQCFGLGIEGARYCIGGEFGRDSAPILTFIATDLLAIDEGKSLVAGPSLVIQYPATPEVAIYLKAYSLFGISAQNTSKATIKSDWKFGTRSGANYKFAEQQTVQLTMDYMIRQATLETPTPTGTVKWNSIFSGLSANISYIFSF